MVRTLSSAGSVLGAATEISPLSTSFLAGLSLSQHALVIRNTPNHEKDMHLKGIPVKVVTEEDVFRALNIPYVPPHKRDL